jgi:hypothetical protein
VIKPAAAHQRTECIEALLWLNLSIASTPILIARAKRRSYVIVNHNSHPAMGGTARLLDDDLLPLHFRGTSSAPAITMPAVYQA